MGLSAAAAKWVGRKALNAAKAKYGNVSATALKRCPNGEKGRHRMTASARDTYKIEDDEGNTHTVVLHMCGNGCGSVLKEEIR